MDLKKLAAQLIKHEGFKKFPYTDTVGKLTIGVGHNLTDKGLSSMQVVDILHDDMNEVVSFLYTHLPWITQLDEVRQRVLADMAFDLATKLFDFKHMLAAIQVKEWDKAADELLNSTFAVQTGARATDLAHMLRTGTDV